MDRLLYISMNGAKHSLLQQAVTAQNLANVSTTGYKAQAHAFRAVPVIGEGMPTRTYSVTSTPNSDLSAGGVKSTGRPLDIAVNGPGWIAVQDVSGQEAYTRNGSLQIGGNGLLVTSNGQPVMGDGGPITIPEDSEVTIGKDGTISIVTNNQFNATTAIARIKLVSTLDRDMVRGEAHKAETERMLRDKQHVVYAYGALWILTALFVLYMFVRQRSLDAEIARLRRELEQAAES